ncbi:chromatin assembly factor 1 subunit B [Ostrinia furnacalis]|uniref:chromatin assembly factor 1 subunit B n=1 Tax=Ostrinia furnacalis TaxID=93504 RepID=UPI00103FC947|nr:chromatin assembly factor 1 subunit B [Ostrinia furnacalis]
MKFAIPEISWHNRDPVLSVDFQPNTEPNGPLRLATGGTDSHVLIWYINSSDSGSVNIEVVADLTRHQKAVNVVRWSPNGQLLASGDDESIIFVWQQKTEKETVQTLDQGEEQYKETWVIHKTLRGHMEDVLDLSWSPDSLHLASGSVDNKLLVWDVTRGRYTSIITDHKGFIQGVSWDPQGSIIATASTDRVFRTIDVNTKKVVSRSSKATLPFPPDHPLHEVKVRLYHDDTLQTYFRRLHFSPDGLLLAVPAGRVEPDQAKVDVKPINAVYIYTRYSLKVPACILPCGEPALAVRWAPLRFSARREGPAPALPAPRMLLAVATKRSVLLYDTQQKTPVALISNIHYTRLTDLSWSPDARRLVASSTDGYCSVISFDDGELGDVLPEETPALPQTTEDQMEVEEQEPKESQKTEIKEKAPEEKQSSNVQKIDSFIKFKTPSQKSPKKQKIETNQQKTPIKIDVLEEVAMPSWNDNSNSGMGKPKQDAMEVDSEKPSAVIEIEDSEDMKLVYDETETKSAESPKDQKKTSPQQMKTSPEQKKESPKAETPKSSSSNNFFKQAKVTDVKSPASKAAPSPKAPRRVSFVTLSSPKNSKKK